MTVGDLILDHDYQFRVLAHNASGCSQPSPPSQFVHIEPSSKFFPIDKVIVILSLLKLLFFYNFSAFYTHSLTLLAEKSLKFKFKSPISRPSLRHRIAAPGSPRHREIRGSRAIRSRPAAPGGDGPRVTATARTRRFAAAVETCEQ